MDASTTPIPAEARQPALTVAKPKPLEPSPASKAAAAMEAARRAEAQNKLAPAKLSVEIDAAAGRFVNILSDADTGQIVRQYPSDAQLAFSRAIRAYALRLAGQ